MVPLLLLLSLNACAKKSQANKQFESQVRESGLLSEKVTSDGLVEQRIDINQDSRPDVFNYLRERNDDSPRRIVRKETDLNMDGRIDVRSWFDEMGNLEKEELDGGSKLVGAQLPAVVVGLVLSLAWALGIELRKDQFLGEWELPPHVQILGRVPTIVIGIPAQPGSGK
ncbi:hypothetical protein DYH09_35455 [bacterium CPR1]|nr:hypothetical protein [bacterium CPR1]